MSGNIDGKVTRTVVSIEDGKLMAFIRKAKNYEKIEIDMLDNNISRTTLTEEEYTHELETLTNIGIYL